MKGTWLGHLGPGRCRGFQPRVFPFQTLFPIEREIAAHDVIFEFLAPANGNVSDDETIHRFQFLPRQWCRVDGPLFAECLAQLGG